MLQTKDTSNARNVWAECDCRLGGIPLDIEIQHRKENKDRISQSELQLAPVSIWPDRAMAQAGIDKPRVKTDRAKRVKEDGPPGKESNPSKTRVEWDQLTSLQIDGQRKKRV